MARLNAITVEAWLTVRSSSTPSAPITMPARRMPCREIPLAAALMERCGGAWGDAEQREYDEALDEICDESQGEIERMLAANAVPASPDELDS